MLELTRGGREPATLPSGETRRFLDDGDEVIFRAYARRDGFAQIGFGECRGRVVGAVACAQAFQRSLMLMERSVRVRSIGPPHRDVAAAKCTQALRRPETSSANSSVNRLS